MSINTIVRKGEQLELEIKRLAFGGRGIAHKNGLVVFVDGALPGQQINARVVKKRQGYAEARVLEVIQPSPQEVEARCRHFGECGGCRFQNFSYQAQLQAKHEQSVESLERIGRFSQPPVRAAIGSPEPFNYRNKMEYSFGRHRWISSTEIEKDQITKSKDFALGLHVRRRYDKILDIDECFLPSQPSIEILKFVRFFAKNSGELPYTTLDHSGYWRHLTIREGKLTGDLLVNLVTADHKDHAALVGKLAKEMKTAFPQITTIVHNINQKKAQIAIGDEERVLYGAGTIKEKIGDCLFQVSANSFFQTNTAGAKLLYDQVLALAEFDTNDLVFDLYAGAGSISIYIARQVRQVVGFEINNDAIRDAQMNCGLNQVVNCSFVAGDVKNSLHAENVIKAWGKPDCLLIDPPRAGMHPKVLEQVLSLAPARIVYISCNPTTFARDAKALCNSAYELIQVQPVDMFPMTPHIELVSLFRQLSS